MKILGASFLGLLLLIAGEARATEIQRVVSPKGIEAWLVEEHTVPLVALSFAFSGGAAQDPAGKSGVANMVSGLLDEGAGDLDSEAFQAALDESSIMLSFDAGNDAFYGSVRTLVDNKDQAARLLKLALTKPRFDAEPVERIRAQILTGIKQGARDPDSVAGDALMAAAFPSHPYGRPVEGTLDSVAAIGVDDLRSFFNKTVARDNLKIAVVGAIDAATLSAMLDEVFGDLPAKANLAGVPETTPAAPVHVDIAMTIPQTIIRFGAPGLKRADPDFIAASIADYILGGGGFSSRLYGEVREKRGLAYSVSLGLSPFDHAGAIFGGTSTRADQADGVVTLIESEIKRFAGEGPTADELAKAKSFLIGSYALRFNTSTKIARQLLAIELDNLGIDYIDRRNALIAAVTLDEVRRVAKRIFSGDDLIVVRVGQKAG
jgi:zinc protease